MTKIVSLKSLLAVAGFAAALSCATAHAQAVPSTPQVKFDPVAEAPSIPAGLQTACLNTPSDTGAPASKTCPVIYYGAYRTWIFSYADNRNSFALVTFDGTGRIVRTVEAAGARYIFDVFSDDHGQKLTLVGQSKDSVVINWADLPH